MKKNYGKDRESTLDLPKVTKSEFVDLTATTPKVSQYVVELSLDIPARDKKKKKDRTIDWNNSQ